MLISTCKSYCVAGEKCEVHVKLNNYFPAPCPVFYKGNLYFFFSVFSLSWLAGFSAAGTCA